MPETPDNSHPNSGVADQKADQRNDYDPAFSGRIEQVVRLAGSVAELARKAGLSERVISKYRAGESDPRCLVPAFGGAIFSQAWKQALWDRFCMGAPQRQRRSVEQYRIVKRAGGRFPSATGSTRRRYGVAQAIFRRRRADGAEGPAFDGAVSRSRPPETPVRQPLRSRPPWRPVKCSGRRPSSTPVPRPTSTTG